MASRMSDKKILSLGRSGSVITRGTAVKVALPQPEIKAIGHGIPKRPRKVTAQVIASPLKLPARAHLSGFETLSSMPSQCECPLRRTI